jgi:hypothetical protein
MMNFGNFLKRSIKPVEPGRPIENITIRLDSVNLNREKRLHALAARYAKELFVGKWHLTENGFLIKGHKNGISHREVKINVSHNASDLIILGRIKKGGIKKIPNSKCLYIHLHYTDYFYVKRIKVTKDFSLMVA